jgi:SM-20-related protein
MKPIKIVDYNDKKIFVYENVFNRRENLGIYDLIVNAPFTRTNIDVYLLNNRDIDAKWWSLINPDSKISSIINPKYIEEIDAFDWSKVAITGQYINYSSISSVDNLHADVFDEKNAYTMLHYANHTWNVNWHGETMFYADDCNEVIYSQIIKPGTVIVFDSRIQHSATSCSGVADTPRYTIATKLFLKT